MSSPNSPTPPVAGSWNRFWQGSGEAGAYASEGASHPAFKAFWDEFFLLAVNAIDRPRLIDLASGNGAVVEHALGTFGDQLQSVSCVDISEAAIRNIRERFSQVDGMVADVSEVPRESESFDIVTSQFGVEYAGPAAIGEAARLLAPGGFMGLLMHHEGGNIQRQCQENLVAVKRVQNSQFLDRAEAMFTAGFAAIGGADRRPYDQAASELAPAVQELESIMKQYGEGIAGGTVATVYQAVGRIHSRIQHYDPQEVTAWLARMRDELTAYAGRMASMVACALDESAFNQIRDDLAENGHEILESGAMFLAEGEPPMAWALLTTRKE